MAGLVPAVACEAADSGAADPGSAARGRSGLEAWAAGADAGRT